MIRLNEQLPMKGRELAITREQRAEAVKSSEIPCDKIEACLETVAASPDAARSALQKGRATLMRGGKAMGYPAYQESWRPESSLASHINPYPALLVAQSRHGHLL
ncbi:MAG TPA: hypothetical protein VFF26_12185 [Gallionella sp.]|nr:hypothetical protein [Gallionella sp.]